jgi:drug/metabolite transporter (DMT)-like permease
MSYSGMSPTVVIVVFAAALLHSSWHAMIKNARDGVTGLAGMNVVSVGLSLFVLPFVPLPSWRVWPVLAGSVLLHNFYKLGLARLYAAGELGHTFPMARGMSPLAATLLAAIFLHEVPSLAHLAGIVTICAGLLLLAAERIGRPGPDVFMLAALVGLSVAAYSVVDGYGVRLSGDWRGFTVWLMVLDGGAFMIVSRRLAGPTLWSSLRAQWGVALISGMLGVVSFCVFLWALGRAPVGMVTALREVSVLFASLIGVLFLHERFSLSRLVGACLVSVGVGSLALL